MSNEQHRVKRAPKWTLKMSTIMTIEEIAEEEDKSVSCVIREALESFFVKPTTTTSKSDTIKKKEE